MLTTWTFTTRDDLVIVGQNSECADMTNPHGHLFGRLHYVQGYNAHGDTKELAVVSGSDPAAQAQTLADRLNARMALGKLPVGFDLWPAGRPIYGSHAYVEYGQDDDLAWERQCNEDEAAGLR
jgi:hypothetical protein